LDADLAAKNNRQNTKNAKTNQCNNKSQREILKSEPFFHDLSSIKVILVNSNVIVPEFQQYIDKTHLLF